MEQSKFPALFKAIESCRRCPLYQEANHAVPGEGSLKAKIMFIGEAPGRKEDQTGRPFVGAAGKLLEAMLASIDMKREDVYITSILKHRPPNNRDPKPQEIQACVVYLDEQMELIKPSLIVALGRHALNYFLPQAKISEVHGKTQFFQKKDGAKQLLLPIYHPASALYDPRLRQVLFDDIKMIPEIIAKKSKK